MGGLRCGGVAAGGDYRPGVGANRTAMEQHPFHFHGHHFWVLAHGVGRWNASAAAGYNLLDPPFRDSYTVFKDGWTAIRFRVRLQLKSIICDSGRCCSARFIT